jgi:hypothetical protein
MNPHRGYVAVEGNNQGMGVSAQKVTVVTAQGAVSRNESFNATVSSGAKTLQVKFLAVLDKTTVKNGDLLLIHHQFKVGSDMDLRHLMPIARMARRRPSKAKLITVTIAVVAMLFIFSADKFGLAPDWMSVERRA